MPEAVNKQGICKKNLHSAYTGGRMTFRTMYNRIERRWPEANGKHKIIGKKSVAYAKGDREEQSCKVAYEN